MTTEPATPCITPDPAALLPPDLVVALTVLEHEMLRRALDYSAAAQDGPSRPPSAPPRPRNLRDQGPRLDPDDPCTPRARRLARQARRAARFAARYAPSPESIPQPAPDEPIARKRRFDADTRYLLRFCSIRKTILEANRLNPGAGPLPDPCQFLPDDLVRALVLVEEALKAQTSGWQHRRVRPCQREFQLALEDLCRAVAIRKTLLDLSRISPRAPDAFPGWSADSGRDPFTDNDPPIPLPDVPPLPTDDPTLNRALETRGRSVTVPVSSPPGSPQTGSELSASSYPSRPSSFVPAFAVRVVPTLHAISPALLRLADRFGSALIYLRPSYKNPVIFRLRIAAEKFITWYDPHIADRPPANLGAGPDPPPVSFAPA